MFEKLMKNDYALNIFNKIYTVLIGLFSTAFMTRYLGLSLKGDYAYIIQVSGIIVLILNLGIPETYSYFYKRNHGRVYQKYLNLYVQQTIVYTLGALLVGIVFRNNQNIVYVCVLIPFSLMYQQMENAMVVENIRLRIKMRIVNATAKFVLYGLIYGLRSLIGCSLFYPILLTALIDLGTILIYTLNNRIKPHPFQIDRQFIIRVLKYSWLPMLTALLITLNYSVDILFLKAMGDPAELSLYSTAAGIINYVWFIPDAFKEVLVSRVARSDDLRPVHFALKISLAAVAAITAGFAVFGKFALRLLYGGEFVPSYGIVLILILGCFSMVFYKIIGILMLAEGRRVFYFVSLLISVIVNITVNYFVIPPYGMYGAAWASVGSYTVCGVLFLVYYLRVKKQRIRDVLLPDKQDIRKLLGRRV